MRLGLAALYLTGCAGQGALQPHGPKADAIAELGGLFFWITLVVLAVAVIAAVWAFSRSAPASNASEDGAMVLDPMTERRLTGAVWLSTFVSLVLLAVLLLASMATGRERSELSPKPPLRVQGPAPAVVEDRLSR